MNVHRPLSMSGYCVVSRVDEIENRMNRIENNKSSFTRISTHFASVCYMADQILSMVGVIRTVVGALLVVSATTGEAPSTPISISYRVVEESGPIGQVIGNLLNDAHLSTFYSPSSDLSQLRFNVFQDPSYKKAINFFSIDETNSTVTVCIDQYRSHSGIGGDSIDINRLLMISQTYFDCSVDRLTEGKVLPIDGRTENCFFVGKRKITNFNWIE